MEKIEGGVKYWPRMNSFQILFFLVIKKNFLHNGENRSFLYQMVWIKPRNHFTLLFLQTRHISFALCFILRHSGHSPSRKIKYFLIESRGSLGTCITLLCIILHIIYIYYRRYFLYIFSKSCIVYKLCTHK